MTLTLLLAPSGVGLKAAETFLDSLDDVAVVDVEKELLDNPEVWLDKRFLFVKGRDMRALLGRLTHTRVTELWRTAFDSAFEKLSARPEAHKVLAFHPSLYAYRRSEQYSLIGHALQHPGLDQADRVIVLIDDIFDMWQRLGSKNEDLFHQDEWLRTRAEAQDLLSKLSFDQQTRKLTAPDDTSDATKQLFARLAYGSSLTILEQLIQWRHLDMIEADTLATIINAELTCFGVKHPKDALTRLVTNSVDAHGTTVYLSHPISRPRRQHRLSGTWPDVVADSNRLSSRFIGHGVVLVCPTAIDEFRVEKGPTSESILRRFRLSERWPLIAVPEDAINVEQPSDVLIRLSGVESLSEDTVSTFARSLEESIYAEVPFRDHFLVTHTNGFLVYRPLYEQGRFSGGVQSEIRHWSDSFDQGEESRRALFVHAPADVKAWLARFESTQRFQNIRQYARDYLLRGAVPEDQVDDILEGAALPAESLDQESLTDVPREKILSDAYQRAGELTVFLGLTELEQAYFLTKSNAAKIVILHANDPSDAEIRGFAQFLTAQVESAPLPQETIKAVELVLGKTLAEWASELSRRETKR